MAVADVFTAVTEDRPYRKGMDDVHSMKVLNELVVNGGLDHRIVQVLQDDFDAINQIRSNEQAEYNVKQETLLHIMPSEVNGMMVA